MEPSLQCALLVVACILATVELSYGQACNRFMSRQLNDSIDISGVSLNVSDYDPNILGYRIGLTGFFVEFECTVSYGGSVPHGPGAFYSTSGEVVVDPSDKSCIGTSSSAGPVLAGATWDFIPPTPRGDATFVVKIRPIGEDSYTVFKVDFTHSYMQVSCPAADPDTPACGYTTACPPPVTSEFCDRGDPKSVYNLCCRYQTCQQGTCVPANAWFDVKVVYDTPWDNLLSDKTSQAFMDLQNAVVPAFGDELKKLHGNLNIKVQDAEVMEFSREASGTGYVMRVHVSFTDPTTLYEQQIQLVDSSVTALLSFNNANAQSMFLMFGSQRPVLYQDECSFLNYLNYCGVSGCNAGKCVAAAIPNHCADGTNDCDATTQDCMDNGDGTFDCVCKQGFEFDNSTQKCMAMCPGGESFFRCTEPQTHCTTEGQVSGDRVCCPIKFPAAFGQLCSNLVWVDVRTASMEFEILTTADFTQGMLYMDDFFKFMLFLFETNAATSYKDYAGVEFIAANDDAGKVAIQCKIYFRLDVTMTILEQQKMVLTVLRTAESRQLEFNIGASTVIIKSIYFLPDMSNTKVLVVDDCTLYTELKVCENKMRPSLVNPCQLDASNDPYCACQSPLSGTFCDEMCDLGQDTQVTAVGNSVECVPCARGRYRDDTLDSCTDCPTFYTTEADGTNDIANCSIPACPTGTVIDITSFDPAQGVIQTGCRKCPIDQYQPDKWQDSCLPCPTGTGNNVEGSSACQPISSLKITLDLSLTWDTLLLDTTSSLYIDAYNAFQNALSSAFIGVSFYKSVSSLTFRQKVSSSTTELDVEFVYFTSVTVSASQREFYMLQTVKSSVSSAIIMVNTQSISVTTYTTVIIIAGSSQTITVSPSDDISGCLYWDSRGFCANSGTCNIGTDGNNFCTCQAPYTGLFCQEDGTLVGRSICDTSVVLL